MELKVLVPLKRRAKTHTVFGRGSRSNQGACMLASASAARLLHLWANQTPHFSAFTCCWQSLRTFIEVL